MKRLGKWLQDNNVEDPVLISLEDESEHLAYEDNSLPYSKVLLYLNNMSTFAKYNFEMDKISQKAYMKVVNIIEKVFNYLKEIMNMKYIHFTGEENDAFNKQRRDFRAVWHAANKVIKEKKKAEYEEERRMGAIAKIPSLVSRGPTGTKIRIHSKMLAPARKKSEGEKINTEEDIARQRLTELVKGIKMEYEKYNLWTCINS